MCVHVRACVRVYVCVCYVCVCMCVLCVYVCVACVRACVCVCMRACECGCGDMYRLIYMYRHSQTHLQVRCTSVVGCLAL